MRNQDVFIVASPHVSRFPQTPVYTIGWPVSLREWPGYPGVCKPTPGHRAWQHPRGRPEFPCQPADSPLELPDFSSRSPTMTARMFHHALGAVSLLLLLRPSAIADDGSLVQRFADPPAQARILKIIHNWPDASPAQNELIRQLTRQGFGGVVCNVSFDDYLVSEAKWRSFQHAVVEAKMAGWALWLYDERGYPSGNAGGIVLRGRPEWEASGLLIADAATEGPSISLAAPPG